MCFTLFTVVIVFANYCSYNVCYDMHLFSGCRHPTLICNELVSHFSTAYSYECTQYAAVLDMEIEDYSVTYFNHTVRFKALHC